MVQAFYRGAWVQGQYRPVRPGVSCAAVRCGDAHAKHASRHGRGLAFGLYVNRDAGILSGGVVQGQYRPVRAGVSCAAVRYGMHMLSTHRDMVAD